MRLLPLSMLLTCLACSAARAEETPPAQACAQGQEAVEGMCLPKCQDGFKADGKLCKQICPERTQDTGTHCLSGPAQFRKKFYAREPAQQ